MKLKGKFTVEAAIIFPVIFLLCIVYLELALYFMAVEYSKSICNQGLIVWSHSSEEEALRFLEQRLEGQNFLANAKAETNEGKELFSSKRTVEIEGVYTLLFPLTVRTSSSGYEENEAAFVRTTDLLWDLAGRVKNVRDFLAEWKSGS